MPKKTCLNCYWFAPAINPIPTNFGVCAKAEVDVSKSFAKLEVGRNQKWCWEPKEEQK